jgi:CubicO group peptidase (beta-lactamase class C family)
MQYLLGLVCLAALVSAQSPMVFPGAKWTRHTPEQENVDSAKLKAAFDYAGKLIGETYCVSAHRSGYLIGDKYFIGNNYSSTHIIWSTSKAWMATLIGTAERDKKLATTDLMGKYVPEWAINPKTKNMTMDMVMRHCSGRYYDPVTDFVTPQTQEDQTAFSIKLSQQHPPGTHDQYNQMAYQTLQQVYETATGQLIQNASRKEFYGPMQFESDTYWQMKGFFVGTPQKHPLVYGGVTTSCADLGRFGHLWLNQGNWSGKVVFTKDFYNKALSQPDYPFGKARRYGNWGGGPSIKSQGLGNQIVVFNPTNKMVLTRIGSASTAAFKTGDFIDMVMAAVKDPEMRGKREDWFIAE